MSDKMKSFRMAFDEAISKEPRALFFAVHDGEIFTGGVYGKSEDVATIIAGVLLRQPDLFPIFSAAVRAVEEMLGKKEVDDGEGDSRKKRQG